MTVSITELGQRIKEARELAGLTQTALGDALGVDQSGVSRMEQGRDVTTSQLVRIAQVTGRTLDFFLADAASAEPAGVFRTGDASPEQSRAAAQLLNRLADDYEFLLSLDPA